MTATQTSVPAERFAADNSEQRRPRTSLAGVAPPMAWWWWVMAGAAMLVLGLGFRLIVAPRVQDFLLSLVPKRRHAVVQRATEDMAAAMGGYLRGVFISGLVISVATYVGLLLLGVEYPLLLALMAGSLEAVPVLGTLISSAIIVIAALLQSVQLALYTLAFVVVLQLFEGNVLFPNVMSSQTEMSPLLGLLAFFAGSVVGGILGALVAIPVAAALRVLAVEIVAPLVRRWTGAAQEKADERDSDAHSGKGVA